MTVLTGKAHRSGSSRCVKPSITRLATWPGAGALSQLSTGANSHASGSSVPPERRYFRYCTASRQTVPTTPARMPPATAASGVSGCLKPCIESPIGRAGRSRVSVRREPGERARDEGLGTGSQGGLERGQERRRVVGGQVVQGPGLLGREVGLLIGEPDGPVAVRDVSGVGDLAEVLADGLPGNLACQITEMRRERLRYPAGGGRVVVSDREGEDRLELRILR